MSTSTGSRAAGAAASAPLPIAPPISNLCLWTHSDAGQSPTSVEMEWIDAPRCLHAWRPRRRCDPRHHRLRPSPSFVDQSGRQQRRLDPNRDRILVGHRLARVGARNPLALRSAAPQRTRHATDRQQHIAHEDDVVILGVASGFQGHTPPGHPRLPSRRGSPEPPTAHP